MSIQKKELKDLVAGDKVVLVKEPTCSYYGYGYRIGAVFTVVKACNPIHGGVLVKDVLFRGGIADRYIGSQFIEHYVEEEKQIFTKNDLETGMWVEFACGDIGIVLEVEGVKYVMSREALSTCITKIDSCYNDDLTCFSQAYNIINVWAPNGNCNYLLRDCGRLLWNRPVKTEQELAHEKLMSQIAELEEKTKELREQAKKMGDNK